MIKTSILSIPLRLFAVLPVVALVACGVPAASQGADAATAQLQGKRSAVGPTIRHHPAIASKYLAHRRDVWVYLPPGYERTTSKRYPVLYMNDGNNAFFEDIAFQNHEWMVDEHAERMIRSGELPPLIIVAISNTPDRMAEYSWMPGDFKGKRQGGDGPKYAKFLVEELKPFIDKSYRTKSDPANTGVMGSSMGGHISYYLGRHHADTFGKIGVISPAIFWAERAMIADAQQMPAGLRIWLDMGHKEDRPDMFPNAMRDVRELRDRLVARGYRVGENLGYYEDVQADHNEIAWAYRTPKILTFLFGKS